MEDRFLTALTGLIPEERVKTSEYLCNHTTYRIGGPADYYVTVYTETEAASVVALCHSSGVPLFLLGNGSNLLVSDKGFRGVVLQLAGELSEAVFEEQGDTITARVGAGRLLGQFAREAIQHGAAGFAYAAGIPGSIGGAICMNAGAYGGEIRNQLVSVRLLTAEGSILEKTADRLELSYRHSALQKENWYVLTADFCFEKGDRGEEVRRVEELSAMRRAKQPLEYPSAGSTFKRPEGYFAGKLIMDAGLAGFRIGGACVSEKHCGFVVNTGQATARDVWQLIRHVQAVVMEKAGVMLEPEVRMLGEFDELE